MKKAPKKSRPKIKLGIPDLEHSKAAVLRSLRSPDSRRGYQHAINGFVAWYCPEPRLSFNKPVVLRYRIYLEDQGLSAGTINLRLAAVRRLAFEAADCGLLSPELAAGIQRVKGLRTLGSRLGNWLTVNDASALWQLPDNCKLKGKRNRAMLAILLGCGLRRRELAELNIEHLQRREERWAIIDLVGKGGHIRTVPISAWLKETIDTWMTAGCLEHDKLFRCVCRARQLWGDGISEKVAWHVVKQFGSIMGLPELAPHDLRRSCARLCHNAGGELEQIQFLLGTFPCKRRNDTSVADSA